MNRKRIKIILGIAIILSLVLGFQLIQADSIEYTNKELDDLIAKEITYQYHAHQMAESARVLGYPEDSYIIQTAKKHYSNSENNIAIYKNMYVDLTTLSNEDLIIYLCKENNIDPLLPLSISRLETGYFTSSAFINKNNFGGMMGRNGLMSFSTREEGARAYINLITKYYAVGLNTPWKMESKYCPEGNGWARKVASIMKKGL